MKKKLGFALILGLLIALAVYTGAMAEECEHLWSTRYLDTHQCSKCFVEGDHEFGYFPVNNVMQHRYKCVICELTFRLDCEFSDYINNNDATCFRRATQTRTCSSCGRIDTQKISGTLQDHSFINFTSNNDATCTVNDTETAKCRWYDGVNCTATYTREIANSATGHSYLQGKPSNQLAQAATCTTPNWYYIQCDKCNNVSTEYTTSQGDPLGHDWGAPRYLWTDAQGNPGGYDLCIASRECANDSAHTETEAASARSTFQRQTCTDPEQTTYFAAFTNPAFADQTKVIQTKEAAGHSYTQSKPSNQLVQAATCTTPDWYYVQCDNCDYVNKERTISINGSKLGHSFTNYVPNGNATCTADGTKTAPCDRCTATQTITDDGSALGHTEVTDPALAPTCTATGLTEGKHCSVCEEILLAQTVVDALGHDYAAVITAPTCVEKGFTTYTCARCSDAYTADAIPARDHWYGPWSPDGDAAHSASCLRCGCGYVKTVACAEYPLTVDGTEYTVCPVCGRMGGETLAAVDASVIGAVYPRHAEKIVRGQDGPFSGVLYILTVAHEIGGEITPYTAVMQAKLPLSGLPAFRLVRADGETRTEIPFTFENGVLTFETDAAGVYLLLPAE